ncbi:zinc finger-containing ubiquitin peptidase 1 [Megalops cyprinoides]|uniref:zinc finger-containing ubiquitin peptidase 1 n=1 Tax=Megalops cyprinoides TaxID=118141 RepID=UPI00186444E5|nr:zinc finger-containing ubiquitin peptidase 1 [Megalops cyprinoides]XP_036395262.1 zinc finger-containing ubiquitin peptidase 1 [Megalops cyprinoides]
MLTCEICGEGVISEADMRTHLLLSHLENEMRCPLCSLAGVSYDELHFHIHTAHAERGDQSTRKHRGTAAGQACTKAGGSDTVANGGSPSRTCSGASPDRTANEPISDRAAGGGLSGLAAEELLGGTFGNRLSSRVGGLPDQTSAHAEELACPVLGGSPRAPHCAGEESKGNREEPIRTKQKRLFSPMKEKCFPCPVCPLVFSNCFILQEHVELHLQEQGVAEGGHAQHYECPLCSLTCADSTSLQLHVELHLEGSAARGAEGACSDLQLAKQLQEEEERKRKVEEDKREAEEFKKLQRQFGLDGSGGYRKQIEKNLERAVSRGHMAPAEFHRKRAEVMESLASGIDDGRTRTSGLMAALYEYYLKEGRDCAHVWLSAETDHYSSSEGDRGWGCGYRNFQMLLSSLHRMDAYKHCNNEGRIPSIPQVQALIEQAWREGMDPQGASHFNGRLQGSRAWIGATEIYSLFTSLGVRAHLMDFHQPTGSGNTHPRLFEWVKRYFSQSACRGTRLPPRVVQTTQPPIYLQHQGHSRSIVGIEQKKNGSFCLLIFDPGCPPGDMRKLLARDGVTCASLRHLRKFLGGLKHNQYQIVAVEGVLSPEEKRTRIANSRSLRAERIP